MTIGLQFLGQGIGWRWEVLGREMPALMAPFACLCFLRGVEASLTGGHSLVEDELLFKKFRQRQWVAVACCGTPG